MSNLCINNKVFDFFYDFYSKNKAKLNIKKGVDQWHPFIECLSLLRIGIFPDLANSLLGPYQSSPVSFLKPIARSQFKFLSVKGSRKENIFFLYYIIKNALLQLYKKNAQMNPERRKPDPYTMIRNSTDVPA